MTYKKGRHQIDVFPFSIFMFPFMYFLKVPESILELACEVEADVFKVLLCHT